MSKTIDINHTHYGCIHTLRRQSQPLSRDHICTKMRCLNYFYGTICNRKRLESIKTIDNTLALAHISETNIRENLYTDNYVMTGITVLVGHT